MGGRKKVKSYPEEISFKKSAGEVGAISMRDVCTSWQVDEKEVVRKIMSMKSASSSSSSSSSSWSGASCLEWSSMKLEEKNMARVVPGRITEVKFFPAQDMRMVVAGNNFGNVGFWNVDHEDAAAGGIYVYYPHTGLISGISIHPDAMTKMISSCYDGYIRVLDVEKERFGLAYASEHQVFSICRQPDSVHSLFIGEGHGGAGSLDVRSSVPSSGSWALHKEKIYTIHFNPQNTNLMATASKDGTACIWDLRKLHHLHPQPLKLVRHKATVNAAYFSPSGNLFATTSMDNNIGLISGPNYDVESMIYHSNDTPRFISSFRGIWGWDDSCILVGNKKKGVDIICAEKKQVSYTLANREINAIPCRFDAHPILPGVLAISTAGGRVYVWDV